MSVNSSSARAHSEWCILVGDQTVAACLHVTICFLFHRSRHLCVVSTPFGLLHGQYLRTDVRCLNCRTWASLTDRKTCKHSLPLEGMSMQLWNDCCRQSEHACVEWWQAR